MVNIDAGPDDPRACRELARLGIIRYVPGHGYYPGTRP